MKETKARKHRRKTVSVSSQTFFHLNDMAKQGGFKHPGQGVDKLMRDMMVERRSVMHSTK